MATGIDRGSRVRHPEIHVRIAFMDAAGVVAVMTEALRRARVPQAEIDVFRAEAAGGDHASLLRVCLHWADVS